MRCSVWEGIRIGVGTMGDYEGLKGFHYRGGRPGVVMRVLRATHEGSGVRGQGSAGEQQKAETVGVLVESLPALHCAMRDVAMGGRFCTGERRMRAALLNKEVRCISRVVVHPQYRGIGLAVALVKEALRTASVPYVEALAAMGRVHPFFEQAGMTAYDRPADAKGVRLMAALEESGLRPLDLCDVERVRRTDFLEGELRRFAGKAMGWEALVRYARERVVSWPGYFLKRKT